MIRLLLRWWEHVRHPYSETESYRLEHSKTVLVDVHPRDICAGPTCCIHNKSDHVMRSFPQHWRSDRGIMERICPHGIGHPDPDDPFADPMHGCDGCCFGKPFSHHEQALRS